MSDERIEDVIAEMRGWNWFMVPVGECEALPARLTAALERERSPEREAFVEAADRLGAQVADSGWHLGAPTIERFMETWRRWAVLAAEARK